MVRILLLLTFALPFCSFSQVTYPARIWPDNAYAPFIYGVASGDPVTDRVILWTAVDPSPGTPASITWEIATDSAFTNPVNSGNYTADSANGYTVKVDATGLSPGTRYWYRFRDGSGNYSRIGRTRTAPAGTVQKLKFAVASCSSIYSGFFSAYREIANISDLDLFIHLGDYIYDYADQDELVRVPVPAATRPVTLAEFRERHRYYLLDPDLRLVRQMHPATVIWDNHDISNDSIGQEAASIQAFWEYLPCRQPDSLNPEIVYRQFAFGDLVDVYMTDGHLYRGKDTMANGFPSYLGEDQYNWLAGTLPGSNAVWRVIGNQKMFGQWSTAGIPGLPIGNGQVADPSSWDGFPEARQRLLDLMDQQSIEDVCFISGDLHLSISDDIHPDPFGGNYDPNTGAGSVAVEFLPTSISRGNFDESGVPGFLIPVVKAASDAINVHHFYTEYTEHGFGIMEIDPDSILCQYWYVDILDSNSTASLAREMVVRKGENHWARGPLVGIEEVLGKDIRVSLSPNPFFETLNIQLESGSVAKVEIELIEMVSGTRLFGPQALVLQGGEKKNHQIQGTNLAAGVYGLIIRGEDFEKCIRVVRMDGK